MKIILFFLVLVLTFVMSAGIFFLPLIVSIITGKWWFIFLFFVTPGVSYGIAIMGIMISKGIAEMY